MPYEDDDIKSDEFVHNLALIEDIIGQHSDCHVIIGGDFNVDFNRNIEGLYGLVRNLNYRWQHASPVLAATGNDQPCVQSAYKSLATAAVLRL